MKSAVLALCVVAALLATAARAQETPADPAQMWRPFAAGGRIYLDLDAGDYTLKGADDGRISLRWSTKRGRDDERVRTDIQIRGNDATVRVRGPSERFRVQIDVPRRSDIDMTLSAGALGITGLEGNKKVSMLAGKVTVDVGPLDQYRRVDASVRMGQLSAGVFNRSSGGLLRSLRWDGQGKYALDVNLTVGNLRLMK